MLRPSYSSLLSDIKLLARASKNSSQITEDCFDVRPNNEGVSAELRAEQMLLLALHPESPKVPLPSIPDSSQSGWAEPGWQLMLDGYESYDKNNFPSILPRDHIGSMSQKFLSDCCSSGRQAASLIKARHLKMLTLPMSSTCQASAPAETRPCTQDKPSQGLSSLSILILVYFMVLCLIYLASIAF